MKMTIALALLVSAAAQAQTAPRRDPTPQPPQQPRNSQQARPQTPVAPNISARPTIVQQVLSGRATPAQQARRGGSDIGGGVVREQLLAWCDNASGILHDARVEATEVWGMSGDQVEALTLYRDGLETALIASDSIQTQATTFTLRYVQRGLVLSQILGVDDIVDGVSLPNERTNDLVTFFDWYLGFTRDVGQTLDRDLYVPYLSRGVRTIELENRAMQSSVSILSEIDRKFVRTLPDGTNMYSTISVPNYLNALAYLLPQVAGDLRESLFAESQGCQARRLDQLAEQIQRYLATRNGNSQDAQRLNRISLNLRNVVQGLQNQNCF